MGTQASPNPVGRFWATTTGNPRRAAEAGGGQHRGQTATVGRESGEVARALPGHLG